MTGGIFFGFTILFLIGAVVVTLLYLIDEIKEEDFYIAIGSVGGLFLISSIIACVYWAGDKLTKLELFYLIGFLLFLSVFTFTFLFRYLEDKKLEDETIFISVCAISGVLALLFLILLTVSVRRGGGENEEVLRKQKNDIIKILDEPQYIELIDNNKWEGGGTDFDTDGDIYYKISNISSMKYGLSMNKDPYCFYSYFKETLSNRKNSIDNKLKSGVESLLNEIKDVLKIKGDVNKSREEKCKKENAKIGKKGFEINKGGVINIKEKYKILIKKDIYKIVETNIPLGQNFFDTFTQHFVVFASAPDDYYTNLFAAKKELTEGLDPGGSVGFEKIKSNYYPEKKDDEVEKIINESDNTIPTSDELKRIYEDEQFKEISLQ